MRRLRQGALSAERTPSVPPIKAHLVSLDSHDGSVDLHPLLKHAHDISASRAEQYGDWRSTAAEFCAEDLAEYPRTMIRAKLARDPDLMLPDTLVDLVNYAGMLFELQTEGQQ